MQISGIGGSQAWISHQLSRHIRRHNAAAAYGTPALRAMADRRAAHSLQARAATDNAANLRDYTRVRDGWAQQVQTIQSRMSELATLANDGTKSAADRRNLQVEFAQMQREIQRITSGPDAAARFNGHLLFQA